MALDAPSNLGLRPPAPGREPGVGRAPEALRAAGLTARLGALEAGKVAPPHYRPERDPESGIRNVVGIARYAHALANRVEAIRAGGGFPLVLGGDCSILLGTLLALARAQGRYGLAFVDGHADFLSPEESSSGGAAGMDLALATGRGPAALARLAGEDAVLVRDEDVAVLGFREADHPASRRAAEALNGFDLDAVVREGPAAVAARAVEALAATDGFLVHLDVDVLDPEYMPAVDSPDPGGLRPEALRALLGPLLASGRAVGLELTIFDPDGDPTGRHARTIVDVVAGAFEDAAVHPPR